MKLTFEKLIQFDLLVVSARFNRTYTNVTRISFHEKSSDYYSGRIRETLS